MLLSSFVLCLEVFLPCLATVDKITPLFVFHPVDFFIDEYFGMSAWDFSAISASSSFSRLR